jgi:hypothetical protein
MWFSSFIVDFGGSFVFVVVMGLFCVWAVVAISIYAPTPPFFPMVGHWLYFDFDVGNIPFPAIVGGVDGGEGYYGNSETHI